MPANRLEIRLDDERRRKLAEVAATRGTPVSDAVRIMIDEAYEAVVHERRLQAARALAAMAVEEVPDATTLARQLEDAHEPTGLS